MWLESSRERLQIFAISAQLPPRMYSHQHMHPSSIYAQSHVHFYVLNIHSKVCCCLYKCKAFGLFCVSLLIVHRVLRAKRLHRNAHGVHRAVSRNFSLRVRQ